MMTECCRTFPVVDVAEICPQYSGAEAGRAHNTIKYYCWIYRGLHLHKLSGEIIKTKRGKINSFPSRVRRVVRIYLNLII